MEGYFEHEVVYDFILDKARHPTQQPTSEAVYNLLVDRTAEQRVREALNCVVESPGFGGEPGLLFMNRCVHTAINPMHLDGTRHGDLKRLIRRLTEAPKTAINPTTKHLRQTLHRYTQDEKFQCVLRQVKLYQKPEEEGVLEDLFADYSFLYLHAAVSEDIGQFDTRESGDGRQRGDLTVGMRRRKKEKIYAMRRALYAYWHHRRENKSGVSPNPTRLKPEELDKGIYLYNTNRAGSFRKQAQAFSNRCRPEYGLSDYRVAILEYMTYPLHILVPQHQDMLTTRFDRVLNTMEIGDGYMRSTVIQAFKKLLDDLMFTGSEARRANYSLERYTKMLSPRNFAAILLNLVLGCPMILHKLEERLASLYIHHEKVAIESLKWLIEFFEYMQLALVMNFRYLMSHSLNDEREIPPDIIGIDEEI